MKSAPLHGAEEKRIKTLQEYEILDTEAEETFDELTQLASTICGTSISLVSLVDEERQWFKSRLGLDAAETDRTIAFCSHAILQDNVFEVPNALEDDRFSDNPLVTGSPDIRFYAGAPLISENGSPLGTLCVIDQQPKKLTSEQLTALKVLSHQVVTQMELRIQNRRLERLKKARERVYAVLAHDLRSPFSVILGLARRLSAKANTMSGDDVTLASNSILSASTNLYQTLDELLQWGKQSLGAHQCDLRVLELKELLEDGVSFFSAVGQSKGVRFALSGTDGVRVVADEVLCKAVVRNVLANAVKFSPEGEEISIVVSEKDDQVVMQFTNQGEPISEDIRDSLFHEVVESHGDRSGDVGSGLGLSLCGAFTEMQGGQIYIDQGYSLGVRVCFSLPSFHE